MRNTCRFESACLASGRSQCSLRGLPPVGATHRTKGIRRPDRLRPTAPSNPAEVPDWANAPGFPRGSWRTRCSRSSLMSADRNVYSNQVVYRLQDVEEVINSSEDWHERKNLPLPAQMFRMGAQLVAGRPTRSATLCCPSGRSTRTTFPRPRWTGPDWTASPRTPRSRPTVKKPSGELSTSPRYMPMSRFHPSA